jgi:hypothetical protein
VKNEIEGKRKYMRELSGTKSDVATENSQLETSMMQATKHGGTGNHAQETRSGWRNEIRAARPAGPKS